VALHKQRAGKRPAFGWPAVACLAVLAVLTRGPDLYFHYIDWDEAALMAESWAMTKGQVLYRDIVQIHPVLNLWIMVPFFRVFRPEWAPLAIKTMNLLLVLLGAVLVGRLAFQWLENRALSFTGAFLFILYCSAVWALSSYGEFYMMFPLLLSVGLLFFSHRPTGLGHYVTGVLWGVAFFFKQVAVFDVIAIYLAYVCLARTSRKSKETATGLMMLGLASVAAAVSVYFFCHAALLEAWRWMLVGPLFYAHATGPRWPTLVKLATRLRDELGLSLSAAIPGVVYLVLKRGDEAGERRPDGVSFFAVLLIWLCSDLVGLCAAGRFYDHYLLQLVPQASLLPLFIMHQMGTRARTVVLAVGGACLVSLMGVHLAVNAGSLIFFPPWNLARARLVPERVSQSTAVADYVRRHTRDSDRIFLYKTDNLDIFFLSQRLSNNGVYMFVDMMAGNMHDEARQNQKRMEFLSHLPALIVVDPDYDRSGIARAEVRKMSVAFFEDVLRSYYVREATVEGLQIYGRGAADPPPLRSAPSNAHR
jgi:hypothetical protein